MKKTIVTLFVAFCLSVTGAWANKTKVEVKAPAEVKAGTEVTITLNVVHSGNSKGHHTDWVYLKINGKEVKRWEYNKEALPPGATFTVEYKYVAGEELKLDAQGHCNIHGSAGAALATVKIVN